MKERPILFGGPMVRAILSGQKTVTRRPIKATKAHADGIMLLDHGNGWWPYNRFGDFSSDSEGMEYPITCPYGQPGDRLWVREAFGLQVRHYGGGAGEHIVFRATNPDAIYCKSAEGHEYPVKWKPSIHMPRHSSRILLEITDVRVERLQDITEEQARSEGIIPHVRGGWHWHPHNPSNHDDWHQFGFKTPFWAFHDLWVGISGQDGWDANPWVWVVEFKRVMP